MQNEKLQQKTVGLQADIEQIKQALGDQKDLDAALEKQAEDLKNSIDLLRKQQTEFSLQKKMTDAKKKSKGKESQALKVNLKDLKKQIAKSEKELKAAEQRKEKAETAQQEANYAYFKVSQSVADARKRLADAQALQDSQPSTSDNVLEDQ